MKNHLLKYKIEEYEATKHEYFDKNDKCHPSVYAHGVAGVQARLITEMKFEIERLENNMGNAIKQLNK